VRDEARGRAGQDRGARATRGGGPLTDELERIIDELDRLVRNDGILLLRANEEERTLTPVSFRGDPNAQIRSSGPLPYSGLTGRAVERRTPMVVNDAHMDPRAIVFSDPVVPEALLIYPLLNDGALVGALNLWRDGPGKQFDDADLESVRPFAERVAQVL
jgi:GAF domain-containing protein